MTSPLRSSASTPRRLSLTVISAPRQPVASGMTLIGFLRGEQMNVYAGHERIAQE
jgi:formate dehydrogenase assembly factor FdhD